MYSSRLKNKYRKKPESHLEMQILFFPLNGERVLTKKNKDNSTKAKIKRKYCIKYFLKYSFSKIHKHNSSYNKFIEQVDRIKCHFL